MRQLRIEGDRVLRAGAAGIERRGEFGERRRDLLPVVGALPPTTIARLRSRETTAS
jgi:hypothetical protein